MLEALLMGGKKKEPFVFYTATYDYVVKTDTVNGSGFSGQVWRWNSPERIYAIEVDSDGDLFVLTKYSRTVGNFVVRKIVDGVQVALLNISGSSSQNRFSFCLGGEKDTFFLLYKADNLADLLIRKFNMSTFPPMATRLSVGLAKISYSSGYLYVMSIGGIGCLNGNSLSGNLSAANYSGSMLDIYADKRQLSAYALTSQTTRSCIALSGTQPSVRASAPNDHANTAEKITTDPFGNVIVSHSSDLIQKFDSDLNLLWAYSQTNVFRRPESVCDADGFIYSVMNGGAIPGAIRVLDPSGSRVDGVPTPVSYDDTFMYIAAYQPWRF